MSTQVRAKFFCFQVAKSRGWSPDGDIDVFSSQFHPVYSDDPESENRKYWEATPSGKIEMDIINGDYFEVGAEYEVTFRKVEK